MSIGFERLERCDVRSCHGNGYPPQSREQSPMHCKLTADLYVATELRIPPIRGT